MKSINLLYLFLLIILSTTSLAQKKIPVTAAGKYEARDLTLEEVRNKAIDEAKKNAMVKAGISENVQVSDFLYTFEDDEKFQDIFQSFVSTETGADIIVEEVIEKKRDINEFGNILIEVEIKAVVYKHKSEKDPTFKFRVDGIKEFYMNGDPVEFEFLPAQDGYLKIFNVTNESASVLYPYADKNNSILNDKKGELFKKNLMVRFPVNPNMDYYYFDISDDRADKEFNLLIFVYTKKDIPFLEDENVNSIMRWIYELPLDEREVAQYGIIVRK
ncbi:MAG: hypothetical protein R2764_05610 [Bacteroidales bacterium]